MDYVRSPFKIIHQIATFNLPTPKNLLHPPAFLKKSHTQPTTTQPLHRKERKSFVF
jgi:hypothetical protein